MLFCLIDASHVLESQAERVPAGLDAMGVCGRQRQISEERLGWRRLSQSDQQGGSEGCTDAGCQEGHAAWKRVYGGAAVKMDEGKGF